MNKIRIVFYVMCITLVTIGTGWAGAKTPPPIQETDWQLESLQKDVRIIELTITIFQKQLLDAKRVLNSYLLEIAKERLPKAETQD